VADILAGAATIVDLELRAKFGEGFSASLGADNLLDKYPTPSTAAQNTTGARSFTSFSPFGFNGRFLYARLGYQW
jgi:iron complex outermembrane receptor protein